MNKYTNYCMRIAYVLSLICVVSPTIVQCANAHHCEKSKHLFESLALVAPVRETSNTLTAFAADVAKQVGHAINLAKNKVSDAKKQELAAISVQPVQNFHMTVLNMGPQIKYDRPVIASNVCNALAAYNLPREVEIKSSFELALFNNCIVLLIPPHVLGSWIKVSRGFSDVVGVISEKGYIPHITLCRLNGSSPQALNSGYGKNGISARIRIETALKIINRDLKHKNIGILDLGNLVLSAQDSTKPSTLIAFDVEQGWLYKTARA